MLNNNSLMDEATPLEFYLSRNYPNPFKEKTVIKYCVAYKTKVQLIVYDSEGKVVEKLVDEQKQPGTYEAEFYAHHPNSDKSNRQVQNLPDGYYFYRLVAGDYMSEKKWLCKNELL